MSASELLIRDAAVAGIALTESNAQALVAYLNLLGKWNAVYNLTAIRDPEQMRIQHLLDSLVILPYLDAAGVRSVIDIGTGGGLPGVVIAIMRPEWRVLLNDIVHKKTAFLTQVRGELGLKNVLVHTGRAEELSVDGGFDAVVSRAFADLEDFVNWGRHLVAPKGAMYAMKGHYPADEIARLPEGCWIEQTAVLNVPKLAADRHLVIVKVDEEADKTK